MYYPDVPALEPDELNLLCNEYMEHNATLDPHLADQMGVKRGLRNLDGTGVLAGITNVSNVIGYDKKPDGTIAPIPGRLVYRGIDIDTLAAEADAHDRFMFEEVIWLLLFGSLPTQEQYAKFRKLLEHHRELPQGGGRHAAVKSLEFYISQMIMSKYDPWQCGLEYLTRQSEMMSMYYH